jgi:hypothetical protein
MKFCIPLLLVLLCTSLSLAADERWQPLWDGKSLAGWKVVGKGTWNIEDGAQANIRAFHEQVMAKDTLNPTVEPSVMSNLVAIMGRIAAYGGRSVAWSDVVGSKQKLQADLSGLQA